MMQFLRMTGALLLAVLMTACGGGGGSAGTTPGGTGGTGTGTVTATITLALVDSTGASTNTVGSISPVFARATVRDATGGAVAGQVVTFSGDGALVRFVPVSGTALTDPTGVASVQVAPASSSSAGAGVLQAAAKVGGVDITQSLTFQVPQGTSDTASSRVANFALLLDKSTLSNSGTATAKLTVVAVDSKNNVVQGAAVTVSTDANTVFTPGGTATDAQGQYTGQVGPGSDKTDRQVIMTVTVNGIVKQTSLQIAGSQIEMTATPSVLVPGGTSTLTVRVSDAASQPIANKTVTLAGDIAALAGRQVATDVNGRAIIGFSAPTAAGSYIVQASASGVSSQMSLQVGSSAVIPLAVIPIGAQPSLSAVPNVLAPNASGSTTNQAQLRFLFLDGQNQPIPNVRVRFSIASSGLGSFDSSISTGNSTVYTNASGVAAAAFISGPTGSPTDGIVVRACYQDTDFASATECGASVEVHLTIAAQALAVSIGNDNLLTPGPGTYVKQFVVSVADSAGRAVPNAPVDISLDLTHYGKGLYNYSYMANGTPVPSLTVVPLDLLSAYPSLSTNPSTQEERVWCPNEDTNRNGFVDVGENVNNSFDSFGQPTLEPRRSDMIVSYVDPAVRTTNASGILLIKVEYSQRFATWLAYRVRATTSVAGSQGSAERTFVTTFLDSDAINGSFHTPPYGTSACNSPN